MMNRHHPAIALLLAACLCLSAARRTSVALHFQQEGGASTCSAEAWKQLDALNFDKQQEKKSGRGYVRCKGGGDTRWKISCKDEDCKPDSHEKQVPGQDGWCFVSASCGGMLSKCKPLKAKDVPTCDAAVQPDRCPNESECWIEEWNGCFPCDDAEDDEDNDDEDDASVNSVEENTVPQPTMEILSSLWSSSIEVEIEIMSSLGLLIQDAQVEVLVDGEVVARSEPTNKDGITKVRTPKAGARLRAYQGEDNLGLYPKPVFLDFTTAKCNGLETGSCSIMMLLNPAM